MVENQPVGYGPIMLTNTRRKKKFRSRKCSLFGIKNVLYLKKKRFFFWNKTRFVPEKRIFLIPKKEQI
jgi:hypothetical protein